MRRLPAVGLLALIAAPLAVADTAQKLEDVSYVGLTYSDWDFRSIRGEKSARLDGATLILGTHITDYVKVEGRFGMGLTEDSPQDGLKVKTNYLASWYMGPTYAPTEYWTVYGLFGFSFVKGETQRDDPTAFPDIPEKFYSSSFSVSYILGTEIQIHKDVWGTFEFGRIHKDSQTKVRMMQLNLGIKYRY
ncbi:outer membrane beta-barrel protein [Hahella sp. SMD15-11]|uniref:Outer membrane beta-barrel protein n=1 Tax=Thermohahella caldifontis TaxID=3142973 RepID=A0AB39UW84_9GAMM